MIRLESNGMWLSLVERCVRDAEAAGSNPVIPTKKPLMEISGFFVYFLPIFLHHLKVRGHTAPAKAVSRKYRRPSAT